MARPVLRWPAEATIAILEQQMAELYMQLRQVFGPYRAAQIIIATQLGPRRGR